MVSVRLAITCPCYWVDPVGASFIGVGGGIVVIWGIDLLEWFRIDDPIGAVPVHMDIHEHGAPAYPEFVTDGKDGTPKSVDEARQLDRGKLPMPSASAGN